MVNPNFRVADIMIIEDHINMMPEHPLRGKNIDELGIEICRYERTFYNRKMIAVAEEVAKKKLKS